MLKHTSTQMSGAMLLCIVLLILCFGVSVSQAAVVVPEDHIGRISVKVFGPTKPTVVSPEQQISVKSSEDKDVPVKAEIYSFPGHDKARCEQLRDGWTFEWKVQVYKLNTFNGIFELVSAGSTSSIATVDNTNALDSTLHIKHLPNGNYQFKVWMKATYEDDPADAAPSAWNGENFWFVEVVSFDDLIITWTLDPDTSKIDFTDPVAPFVTLIDNLVYSQVNAIPAKINQFKAATEALAELVDKDTWTTTDWEHAGQAVTQAVTAIATPLEEIKGIADTLKTNAQSIATAVEDYVDDTWLDINLKSYTPDWTERKIKLEITSANLPTEATINDIEDMSVATLSNVWQKSTGTTHMVRNGWYDVTASQSFWPGCTNKTTPFTMKSHAVWLGTEIVVVNGKRLRC